MTEKVFLKRKKSIKAWENKKEGHQQSKNKINMWWDRQWSECRAVGRTSCQRAGWGNPRGQNSVPQAGEDGRRGSRSNPNSSDSSTSKDELLTVNSNLRHMKRLDLRNRNCIHRWTNRNFKVQRFPPKAQNLQTFKENHNHKRKRPNSNNRNDSQENIRFIKQTESFRDMY